MRCDKPSAGEVTRSQRLRRLLRWLPGACASFALVSLLGFAALRSPTLGIGLVLTTCFLLPLLLWQALRANARLRASEERLRVLASASARILWSATPDGGMEDSDSWRGFTGQTREQCVGAGWLEAVHPED